ncbi:MAG: molybdopterin-dependent oxidoreductase [Ignavibacteriae bacterium]|nr:molybdopterin-dependent oxidoreductase [Ignavibacteria bacterium]MBI3363908.1 molybdopterin-dependent oxidoreductase [Ignavibacteriota bacterium]
MGLSTPNSRFLSKRRKILQLAPLALLAGCDYSAGGRTTSFLRTFQQFNDWVQSKVFDPNKLAPEYSDNDLTPEDGFRINGYDTDRPDIDIEKWTLTVQGHVQKPGEYTLQQITSLPKRVMNTRHCCVEGWSMIPKWGGTSLRNLLELAGADITAKYVAVECGDDYNTSFDMTSVLHPQSILCYEAYNKPLVLEHGAPVRIVMPTKLGYKSAKWIHTLTVTNEKPGGYWEDQGYDWFAGL